MTPAAQYAAAIDVLDAIQTGQIAEKALSNWSRQNRYAGSKDRAAVRDHVFDVLRRKKTCAIAGGGSSGRELILGLLRQQNADLNSVFTGTGYAPDVLTSHERNFIPREPNEIEKFDLPDWAQSKWCAALGNDAFSSANAQRSRAPISLRVNSRRTTIEAAIALLAEDGIETTQHPNVGTCLLVQTNPRRLSQSNAYLEGYVELQDASSQFAVSSLQLRKSARVLDYCAGGGGKSLAIADLFDVDVLAFDVAQQRMKDIPVRATRAQVSVDVLNETQLGQAQPFDMVFCDAPCSGSGAWRRNPDAKWRMSSDDFNEYPALQLEVLRSASKLVKDKGQLVYATCSIFREENAHVVSGFLDSNTQFVSAAEALLKPDMLRDGFYFNVLQKQ